MPLATGELGLNRAVKMPEADRILRNKTAWPQVPQRFLCGTNGGYRRHLHHRTLLYVSSRCQYLTHASPDYTRGIGALLDVGLHVHLLGRSAGAIRKQTQSPDSGGSRVPGFGPPNERERDGKVGSRGCDQRQCKVPAGKRWTSTPDRSRANRDYEMEMGTLLARNSRADRIQIRSTLISRSSRVRNPLSL